MDNIPKEAPMPHKYYRWWEKTNR